MIKAELKRCISIERRWNRNEVSRGSPDKEVNRRPTSLKKSVLLNYGNYYYYTSGSRPKDPLCIIVIIIRLLGLSEGLD